MDRVINTKTYSEIYEILNILGKDFINKLPEKLYLLIDKERDKNYTPNLLRENGILDESKISKETIALFSVLNINYFIQDEEEKKKWLNTFKENEIKHQEELRKKYSPDNIFKNRVISDGIYSENIENKPIKNEKSLIKVKESVFSKIVRSIKNIFHIT